MFNPTRGSSIVDVVVKLGGGALADPRRLDVALRAIEAFPRERGLLIVPGGGPFADAVRETDRRIGLSGDSAHWMAVLGMDQTAHLVTGKLPGGVIVVSPDEIAGALTSGRIPVLAPSAWLRDADPLPHSWDATSDSIAAWVAGRLGAAHLVLVKPAGVGLHASAGGGRAQIDAGAAKLVDPCFFGELPESVAWTILPLDQAASYFADLGERSEGHRERPRS
jgi:aspartokinase-like uncharacterized kinase